MTDLEAAARRLATTLELADAGLEMMRCRLRREHPDATPEQIQSLMRDWLHRRAPLPEGPNVRARSKG